MELELDIAVEDEAWQIKLPDFENRIEVIITKVKDHLDLSNFKSDFPIELSILLSSNDHIQELNATYREKDKPTNILSFPSLDFEAPLKPEPTIGPLHLGDMALAFGVLETEAIDQEKPFEDHFTHLIIHGLLHLLGYDHIFDEEAEVMEACEIQLLDQLAIANPYENKAS